MERYYDPTTGRLLPSPVWWLGTSHLLTEEQWYRHMTKVTNVTAVMCWASSMVGALLFVTWPAPGFGQAIAIALWLWSLLVSPLYFMYRRDVKRYFPNGLDRAVSDS